MNFQLSTRAPPRLRHPHPPLTAEESFRALRTDADAARRRAATLELISDKATALSNAARGELATKMGDLGANRLTCPGGRWAPNLLKWPTALFVSVPLFRSSSARPALVSRLTACGQVARMP